MKIAIVSDAIYPFTLGGSEVRNHEIAKRLVKRGHEVWIIGGKFWKGKNNLKIDGVNILGVYNYPNLYSTEGKRRIIDAIGLSINLFFALLDKDYNLIDIAAFGYLNCFSAKILSLIKDKPLVFTWHQYFSSYFIGYFGFLKGNIARILERLSTKLSKNHIAVSEHVKSELVKRGIRKESVEVIYNGADIKLAERVKKQNKSYDLIYVGRLNYQKNLSLLVESINIAKDNLPGIKVCIIGGGAEKKRLLNLIKKYGLEKNFDFLGEIKDRKRIFSLMKSSKVFVLPSLLEGFPLTIVEANACGLPVITTKTEWNNTSEYISNGKNGIFAHPDKNDFSGKIVYLIKNEKIREKMAKIGKKRAENFDWDKIAEKAEEYYFRILGTKTLL